MLATEVCSEERRQKQRKQRLFRFAFKIEMKLCLAISGVSGDENLLLELLEHALRGSSHHYLQPNAGKHQRGAVSDAERQDVVDVDLHGRAGWP